MNVKITDIDPEEFAAMLAGHYAKPLIIGHASELSNESTELGVHEKIVDEICAEFEKSGLSSDFDIENLPRMVKSLIGDIAHLRNLVRERAEIMVLFEALAMIIRQPTATEGVVYGAEMEERFESLCKEGLLVKHDGKWIIPDNAARNIIDQLESQRRSEKERADASMHLLTQYRNSTDALLGRMGVEINTDDQKLDFIRGIKPSENEKVANDRADALALMVGAVLKVLGDLGMFAMPESPKGLADSLMIKIAEVKKKVADHDAQAVKCAEALRLARHDLLSNNALSQSTAFKIDAALSALPDGV